MSEASDVRKYLLNNDLCNYPLRVEYRTLALAGDHSVFVAEVCFVFFPCVYTHTHRDRYLTLCETPQNTSPSCPPPQARCQTDEFGS